MSLIAFEWVMKQRIEDPTAKLVLVGLANCHNGKTGACFPSYSFLMELTGLSRATISAKLAILKEAGLLDWEDGKRSDGSTTSNRYIIKMDAMDKEIAQQMDDDRLEDGCHPTHGLDGDHLESGRQLTGKVNREEITEPLRFPDAFQNNPEFRKKWWEWADYRKSLKRQKLGALQRILQKHLDFLGGYPVVEAIAILDQSMFRGWSAPFALKQSPQQALAAAPSPYDAVRNRDATVRTHTAERTVSNEEAKRILSQFGEV